MSEQRSPSSSLTSQSTIEGVGPPTTGQPYLTCQWCSVPLAIGVTICPTCGSAGIPDPRMTVAGFTDAIDIASEPSRATNPQSDMLSQDGVLAMPWYEDTSANETTASPLQTLDFDAVERRRMLSIIFIAGGVLTCTLLGWLLGPALLQGPFEALTGTEMENPNDLRTMGTIGGLMVGMFIGATAGWAVWSSN